MATMRLQTIDGQHDATLRLQQGFQALGISAGQSTQLVVTIKQIGDGSFGEDDTLTSELLVDFWDATVFSVTKLANGRDYIETELVVWQGIMGFRFGAIGEVKSATVRVGATTDEENKPENGVEGSDGAKVTIVSPKQVATFRAMCGDGMKTESAVGGADVVGYA